MKRSKKKKAGAAKRQAAPKPATPASANRAAIPTLYMPLKDYRENIEDKLIKNDPYFRVIQKIKVSRVIGSVEMVDLNSHADRRYQELLDLYKTLDQSSGLKTLGKYLHKSGNVLTEINEVIETILRSAESSTKFEVLTAIAPGLWDLLGIFVFAGKSVNDAMSRLLEKILAGHQVSTNQSTPGNFENNWVIHVPGEGILIHAEGKADQFDTDERREFWYKAMEGMKSLVKINGVKYVAVDKIVKLFNEDTFDVKFHPVSMLSTHDAFNLKSDCCMVFSTLQNLAGFGIEWAQNTEASILTDEIKFGLRELLEDIGDVLQTWADADIKVFNSILYAQAVEKLGIPANCKNSPNIIIASIQKASANQSKTNPKDDSKK